MLAIIHCPSTPVKLYLLNEATSWEVEGHPNVPQHDPPVEFKVVVVEACGIGVSSVSADVYIEVDPCSLVHNARSLALFRQLWATAPLSSIPDVSCRLES